MAVYALFSAYFQWEPRWLLMKAPGFLKDSQSDARLLRTANQIHRGFLMQTNEIARIPDSLNARENDKNFALIICINEAQHQK